MCINWHGGEDGVGWRGFVMPLDAGMAELVCGMGWDCVGCLRRKKKKHGDGVGEILGIEEHVLGW